MKNASLSKNLPYILLLVLLAVLIYLHWINDLSHVFAPAGLMILHGEDPYSLQTGYFLYWPLSFWFFPLTALHSVESYLIYILDAVLLVAIVKRLNISPWWCLYPPALVTIVFGQLDILILFLLVEAYYRRDSRLSILLVAATIAIKPQTAIFWILPWLWTLKNHRQRILYCLAVGLVLVIPALVGLLITPNEIITLWQHWYSLIHQTSGVYADNSLSLWALGMPAGGVIFFVLSLVFSRNRRFGLPMMALGMPAMGYYSSVVLIGVLPTWGILVGYVSVALTIISLRNFYWIEPVVIIAYWLWQYRRASQATLHDTAFFPTGQISGSE